jgi:hypothetical protein
LATSSGVPRRPSGTIAAIASMNSGLRCMRMPSVRMLPGSMPLTVIRSAANSSAAERMKPLIPALLAA